MNFAKNLKLLLSLAIALSPVTAFPETSLDDDLSSFYESIEEEQKDLKEAKRDGLTGRSGVERYDLVIYGKVPGRFIEGADENSYVSAKVTVKEGIITEIDTKAEKPEKTQGVIVLDDNDVIYPGLIDLHNHTKQNNLPVWGHAQGQFHNRFQWRKDRIYKQAVSGNMNPWIQYGKPMVCAAFRWSEMQAMVLGTTYLQGPSSCVRNFGIHRVEDSKAYKSDKAPVQAPTDIITPSEYVFLWNVLKPMIDGGLKYEEALKNVVHKYCPSLKDEINDVMARPEIKILSDKKRLAEACTDQGEDKMHKKMIRFLYWSHPTIAGKRNYFKRPNPSALIFHLAEGRHNDPYNSIEFEMIKLVGLDLPYVNLVHAVGVNDEGLQHIKDRGMGIIWSPYSNVLLYGETLDIANAWRKGIPLALGSDWTPTGSKAVLEELKIARNYLIKKGLHEEINDLELFKMVTENPATMINHLKKDRASVRDIEEGNVGTIAVGAMGTMIVVQENEKNPYTNLVLAQAKDIQLVIVDGKPQYGNVDYLQQCDNKYKTSGLEILPEHMVGLADYKAKDLAISGEKEQKLMTLGKISEAAKVQTQNLCQFDAKKAFVLQESDEDHVLKFEESTGLNLDRFADIQKLLGISLMNQNRNLLENKGKGSLDYMPPLFTCNETKPMQNHLLNFVTAEGNADPYTENKKNADNELKGVPLKLKEAYNLQ